MYCFVFLLLHDPVSGTWASLEEMPTLASSCIWRYQSLLSFLLHFIPVVYVLALSTLVTSPNWHALLCQAFSTMQTCQFGMAICMICGRECSPPSATRRFPQRGIYRSGSVSVSTFHCSSYCPYNMSWRVRTSTMQALLSSDGNMHNKKAKNMEWSRYHSVICF